MGLLAPLYALAALALAGPILFHLIRRQPRGEVPFSSLMFLSLSPPRLTRRSRLDNLWLLALRVLALLLIAAAFTRPFLRQESFNDTALNGRSIVLLLDTSGSMQRPDVWSSAQRIAGEVLDDLSPGDRVGLYTVDRQLTAHLPLDDLHATDPQVTQRAARETLAQLQPTWHATALVDGLKSIADLLTAQSISEELASDRLHQVILVSDLHSGIRLEGLQGFVWPDNVQLDIRQVLPDKAGNARPGLLLDDAEEATQSTSTNSAASPTSNSRTPTHRVRIENDRDAAVDGLPLSLAWASPQGPLAAQGISVQVPPGQVRVVSLGARPSSADRIVLVGDAWDGDNTLYVVEPPQVSQRILFCGREETQPEDDLSYFLKQAPLGSAGTQRTLEIVSADALAVQLLAADVQTDVQAIVLEPTVEVMQQTPAIEQFIEGGGIVLVCLSQPVQDESTAGVTRASLADFLQTLLQEPRLDVSELNSADFSLLARIDFTHPVFAPLSDPRFNDFSKLRFWSHRGVALPPDSVVRTVASFDDGAAWLLEAPRGPGRVWVLTAGWQPTASGLGLSSKFIPLIMGMLAPQDDRTPIQTHYDVGDRIGLASPHDAVITTAEGEKLDESLIVRGDDAVGLQRPGLFGIQTGTQRRQVAVQVPASESRLAPLDVAELEAYGIAVGQLTSDANRRKSQRQLQREELEGKQRLWQWLLVVGLVVLGIETWLAGYLATATFGSMLSEGK